MGTFQLMVGNQYSLLNRMTGESVAFTLDTLQEYRAQKLLYGVASRHGITVAAGMREIPGRPACFALLPGEKAEDVLALSRQLDGIPWVLVVGGYIGIKAGRTAVIAASGAPQMPLLNSGELWGDDAHPELGRGYAQGYRDRDSMLAKVKRLVEVWDYWKANNRKLPAWCKTTKPGLNNGPDHGSGLVLPRRRND